MYGVYQELDLDVQELRQAFLETQQRLPSPAGLQHLPLLGAAGFPQQHFSRLQETLRQHHLLAVQFDQPLSTDQLLMFGHLLGRLMPETDPSLQDQVEQQCVLNLVSRYPYTENASEQPFSIGALTVHTECSLRSLDGQPRHLVFLCREPGEASASSQTVLIPMEAVWQTLSPQARDLLTQTHLVGHRPCPPILRWEDGHWVFSFRDFGPAGFEWVCHAEGRTAAEVNAALRELLVTLYTTQEASGISWEPNQLVVLDNMRFFHAKTGRRVGEPQRLRHLQRLRVLPHLPVVLEPATAGGVL